MARDGKTVLVLGGGVGGLVAAHELRRHLPAPHRVVLVERSATHLFAPSLLWLMIGVRKAEDIRRPLAPLAQQGIEVVRARSPPWPRRRAPSRLTDNSSVATM